MFCLPLTVPALAARGDSSAEPEAPVRTWAVYYGSESDPGPLSGYDLLVFDPGAHPPLEPLRNAKRQLLAYISVGEVASSREYFTETAPYRLTENPDWPGSYGLDVRDRRWQSIVPERIAPAALSTGFTGFFLDTADTAIELERREPDRYAGMKAATIDLIRRLRKTFPRAPIMLNRGYELLPEAGSLLTYVLGESVYHTWDFAAKRYVPVAPAAYAEQVRTLRAAAEQFPGLQVLTLDYCDPRDTRKVQQIYRVQRANGFVPYVSAIELNRIHPEPAR
jgi:polysaccharide biosynthesis protein PelA